MRLTLAPGWHWGTDIRPGVGTDQCQASHLGVIVSGAVEVVHEDGTTKVYRAGDALFIARDMMLGSLATRSQCASNSKGAWGSRGRLEAILKAYVYAHLS